MSRRHRSSRRDEEHNINDRIRADNVRLIDKDGEQVGIVDLNEALEKAYADDLDLVELAPNADPPVCKIMDYGKYKYEQQKKAAEARKKQKTIDVKEIKFRPTIEEHDYNVKKRNAERFLKGGDKVKASLRFRGREMAHIDIGREVLERLREDLGDLCKTEMEPKMEGRQMIMILAPDTGG